MDYLTPRIANHTFPSMVCGVCMDSNFFRFTILSYAAVAVPANCWALQLMVSSPVFWTDRMKVFEFHMVFAELLFGFLVTPLMSLSFRFQSEVTHVAVKLVQMIFTARIQFQCSVCFERYLAVVSPLRYLKYRPLRYRMSFSSLIWLQHILMNVFQVMLCQRAFLDINTLYFFPVFFINSYCSISVLKALKQPAPGEGKRETSSSVKKKAFFTVVFFQVTEVIGFLPLIVLIQFKNLIEYDTVCTWFPITYSIMVWTGGIYPFMYLYKSQKKK